MTTISPEPTVDEQAAEEFAGRLLQHYTGATLTYLIEVGRRTGLLDAAAAGPATSFELAARAGLTERYVREWLAAMATGGIVEYEPATGRFWLPREHAACLTGNGVDNLAPLAYFTVVLAKHVPAVSEAFRHGGGVAYADYLPELHDVMEALWGPIYDTLLVDQVVPLAPGLAQSWPPEHAPPTSPAAPGEHSSRSPPPTQPPPSSDTTSTAPPSTGPEPVRPN